MARVVRRQPGAPRRHGAHDAEHQPAGAHVRQHRRRAPADGHARRSVVGGRGRARRVGPRRARRAARRTLPRATTSSRGGGSPRSTPRGSRSPRRTSATAATSSRPSCATTTASPSRPPTRSTWCSTSPTATRAPTSSAWWPSFARLRRRATGTPPGAARRPGLPADHPGVHASGPLAARRLLRSRRVPCRSSAAQAT